jgi:mannitol/fructose-specific phosphotransferase system IIA component (Ntr-type)
MWYKTRAQERASQDSALSYALEKLLAEVKDLTSDDLLTELKDVVIQRDEIVEDRFHKLIEESTILDIEAPLEVEDFFKEISDVLGRELNLPSQELLRKFLEREKESNTVIRKGLAIPHIVIEGKGIFKVILGRAKTGIIFSEDKLVHIIFVLVGSPDERNLHLKVLAAIAQIAQNPEFDKKWLEATTKGDLKNIVLLAERRRG